MLPISTKRQVQNFSPRTPVTASSVAPLLVATVPAGELRNLPV